MYKKLQFIQFNSPRRLRLTGLLKKKIHALFRIGVFTLLEPVHLLRFTFCGMELNGCIFAPPCSLRTIHRPVVVAMFCLALRQCSCCQLSVRVFAAPCGLRGCKNRPAPFPGRML